MIDFLRKTIKPKYPTLNHIEIVKHNLIYNLNYLYSLQKQAEIFPVLKSNAYGHGLKEICQILNDSPVKMVSIDSFPEAQIVYKYFKGKVLFLEELPLKAYRYCRWERSEFVVYNPETLKYLSRFGKKVKIHLFLNTGMNREGIDDLEKFIKDSSYYLNKVEVSGFCSHLAEADDSESNFTKIQEERFVNGLKTLNRHKIYPRWVHLGNSAAIFSLKNEKLNAFRPGISFYGYNPFRIGDKLEIRARELKPALRAFSTVVAVHKIYTGDKVSYSNSYQSDSEKNIAVIPFGYFEGLDRRLSSCSKILFNKGNNIFWAKIAGNVCMNLTCLDCLNNEVKRGERVQVISELSNLENSIDFLSKQIGVINYELLVGLDPKIKRLIV